MSSVSSRTTLVGCTLLLFATTFAQPLTDNVFDEMLGSNRYDCSSQGKECRDCLIDADTNETTPCGYVPGFGCMNSCDIIADTACYSAKGYGFEKMAGEDICEVADADEAASTFCYSQEDCSSCVSNNCRWFGPEMGFEAGFCSSECTMVGCGSTTCDDNELGVVVDGASTENESASTGSESLASETTGSESVLVINETENSTVVETEEVTKEEITKETEQTIDIASESSKSTSASVESSSGVSALIGTTSSVLLLLLGFSPVLAL